jgi:hypothetical protein
MVRDARRNRLVAWALAARPRGRPGPPSPAAVVERMTRELELTDAQARSVRGILEERWDALDKLSARFEPEAEAIRGAADDRVRAVLEPAQRERFEQRIAERERRRAELRRRVGADRP